MRPFWRSFWASILAYIVLSVFAIIIVNIIVISISSVFINKDELTIKENSVLEIKLDFKINERSGFETTNNFNNPFVKSYGIHEVKKALQKAKNDDKIKGILLNISSIGMGLSSVDDLRSSLSEFKKDGKFIVAYAETYSMGAFYLSSVADQIYLYPQGAVDFRGLGTELMFFKNALDRLDIDVQVLRGKGNIFKGAVEPFMLDKMSKENKLQIQKLLDDVWKNMTHNIKDSRNTSLEKLNEIADSVYSYNAIGCLNHNLVDGLIYKDQLDSIMKQKMDLNPKEEINSVNFKKYLSKNNNQFGYGLTKSKGNIAVVFAVGDIISGNSVEGSMGSNTIVKAINKAKSDSSIKAVVLRVNSPGGSALASDVIWRSIELTKQVKPVIVSMGDVAASGGYYISCGADRIFAEANTVTGSIGVFGVVPNLGRMLDSKVGITFDRVETNEHAAFTMFNALDKKELSIFQKGVDEIYDTFISKVAKGRDGLKKKDVDKIAKGRVWSGKEALDLELVDEIGNLEKAIEFAANKVNINKDDIKIKEFPKKENDELIAMLAELEFSSSNKNEILTFIEDFQSKLNKTVLNPVKQDKFQMLFPFEIKIQ
ncbi:MAG: signal peptide peptidase SppA [Parvicellaceae bacterium]